MVVWLGRWIRNLYVTYLYLLCILIWKVLSLSFNAYRHALWNTTSRTLAFLRMELVNYLTSRCISGLLLFVSGVFIIAKQCSLLKRRDVLVSVKLIVHCWWTNDSTLKHPRGVFDNLPSGSSGILLRKTVRKFKMAVAHLLSR